MCVAMPGRVISIGRPSPGSLPGVVSIADRMNDVNLVMIPGVQVDDFVVVHSGFAIRIVAEQTAASAIHLLCPNGDPLR